MNAHPQDEFFDARTRLVRSADELTKALRQFQRMRDAAPRDSNLRTMLRAAGNEIEEAGKHTTKARRILGLPS